MSRGRVLGRNFIEDCRDAGQLHTIAPHSLHQIFHVSWNSILSQCVAFKFRCVLPRVHWWERTGRCVLQNRRCSTFLQKNELYSGQGAVRPRARHAQTSGCCTARSGKFYRARSRLLCIFVAPTTDRAPTTFWLPSTARRNASITSGLSQARSGAKRRGGKRAQLGSRSYYRGRCEAVPAWASGTFGHMSASVVI